MATAVQKSRSIPDYVGDAQVWLLQTILRIKPKHESTLQVGKFGWNEVFRLLKFRHVFIAGLALAITLGTVSALSELKFLNVSIASLVIEGIKALAQMVGISGDVSGAAGVVVVVLLFLWRKKVGSIIGVGPDLVFSLPKYALREEIIFRDGAENWSFWGVMRSCISFGLAHITMIIVPVSAAIGLIVPGMIFMLVYLLALKKGNNKRAVAESAIVHTTYNALVLILSILFLLGLVIFEIFTMVTIFQMLK